MEKIILDGNILGDIEKAHEYLKEKLRLPNYYGNNLDALYDCLTEMEEIDIQIVRGETTAYLEKLIMVFNMAERNGEINVEVI